MDDLLDQLLSQGRYSITTTEAAELTGWTKNAAAVGLSRLAAKNQFFSPARGLYVVVPPEFRGWGVIPAELFIDDLMRYLDRDYYVLLLSAAALHGASHQAPQVFQVIVDKRTRDVDIGRVRLRFFERPGTVTAVAKLRRNTRSGRMNVSTKEVTLLDLVAHASSVGGLSNVATIASELEGLDPATLAAAAQHFPRAVVRRTGWLLDSFTSSSAAADALRELADVGTGNPALLSPSSPARGGTDKNWNLRINTEVEPDL